MSSQQKSLVLLAAGLGSRYGGMKQLQPFGPSGECLLDYSIYDGIQAGFNDLVFIIRESMRQSVYDHFMPRWGDRINIRFAHQEIDRFTNSAPYNKERSKPWGTAHALLCIKGMVENDFAIINADDFYGRDAFLKAFKFLNASDDKEKYGLVYYLLRNTLSDHGSVNRGVCEIENDHLLRIEECIDIKQTDKGIGYEKENVWRRLDENCPVSMNFFCFSASILEYAEKEFSLFLKEQGQELKSEFFIPSLLQNMIEKYNKRISVLRTDAKWFGVTYQADNPIVISALARLVDDKVYPRSLWGGK